MEDILLFTRASSEGRQVFSEMERAETITSLTQEVSLPRCTGGNGYKDHRKDRQTQNWAENREAFSRRVVYMKHQMEIELWSSILVKKKKKKPQIPSVPFHSTLHIPFTSTDWLIHSAGIYWMPATHKEGSLRKSHKYERDTLFPWRYNLVGRTGIQR